MSKLIFSLTLFFFISCNVNEDDDHDHDHDNHEDEQEVVDDESSDSNDDDSSNTSIAPSYIDAHDVARIVKDDNYHIVYFSGIESVYYNTSTNKWEEGMGYDDIESPLSGSSYPSWINETTFQGIQGLTAPAMLDERTMYYCIANWETDQGDGCIGRATSSGSPPTSLNWADDGSQVICSNNELIQQGAPFAIDPAVFKGDNNSLWMVYGSHWSGIWVVELDASSGHLSDIAAEGWSIDNSAYTRVARNLNATEEFEGGDIEAPYIHKYGNYYYLFVNWDKCCNGIESTYNIRIGRSENPNGPFLDKDGVNMDDGGGTLFLTSNERFIGPGHAGIFEYDDGSERKYVFTFHFYDRDHSDEPGTGTLGTRMLTWENDWPVLSDQHFIPSN